MTPAFICAAHGEQETDRRLAWASAAVDDCTAPSRGRIVGQFDAKAARRNRPFSTAPQVAVRILP